MYIYVYIYHASCDMCIYIIPHLSKVTYIYVYIYMCIYIMPHVTLPSGVREKK